MVVHDVGLLAGLKVLDLAWVGVGPLTAKYLADHGAVVVHVESSRRPDVLRTMPPFAQGVPGLNRSQFYAEYNSSKLGFGVDLSRPDGRALVRELVAWADVVIESFTPHVLAQWELDYPRLAALNPSLIMLSTCLFGQTGPYRDVPGFGTSMAPTCGFYHLTGYPDVGPVPPYGAYTDFVCHRFTAAALLAALWHRAETGEGQYIDAAQFEMALQFLGPVLLDAAANGRVAGPAGNKSPWAAPHDIYPCRDSDTWCAIAVETDAQWAALKAKMGRPAWAEDPRWDTFAGRKRYEAELDARLAEWTRRFDAGALMRHLQPDVPAGAVLDVAGLFADEQIRALEYFTDLEHPEMGRVPYTGVEFRFSDAPVGLRWAAPTLGQHTYEVLHDILGKSDETIADLLAWEVVEIT